MINSHVHTHTVCLVCCGARKYSYSGDGKLRSRLDFGTVSIFGDQKEPWPPGCKTL